MNHLCIRDLTTIVGGSLRLGALPPLGGELEPIANIVLDVARLRNGDVYWSLPSGTAPFPEEAYLRGALGVVVPGREIEPWAGKFSVRVEDGLTALRTLAAWNRERFSGKLICVVGPDAADTCRMIHAALSPTLTGSRWDGAATNDAECWQLLLGLNSDDDYVVWNLESAGDSEKNGISDLCSPDVLVITGRAQTQHATRDDIRRLASVPRVLPTEAWVVQGADEREHATVRHLPTVWTTDEGFEVDASRHRANLSARDHDFVTARLGARAGSSWWQAFAVGRLLGVPAEEMTAALSRFHPERIGIRQTEEVRQEDQLGTAEQQFVPPPTIGRC